MPPQKIQGSGRQPMTEGRPDPEVQNAVALGPDVSTDGLDPALTDKLADDTARIRKAREPFGGAEYKMNAPKRPGYHLHWFNDRPGRVDRAKRAGYEHVLDERGSPVSMVVDTQPGIGGGMLAYAMEIPEELWREDMKAAQKKIDVTEDAIRRGVYNQKPQDHRYVPRTGINIRRGN